MADFRQKTGRGKSAKGTGSQILARWTRGDRPALIFVGASLLLGGAGTAYPLLSWILFLLALSAIALVLSRHPWSRLPGVARSGLWLAGSFWLLVLAQAVPLPQGLWANLPGHAVAASVVQAAGLAPWRAWSLAPGRTLESLLDVLPSLAALLLLAVASSRRRISVLRLIVAVGAFNALLGVTQFGAGADTAPIFYGTTHRGVAVGLFVNRNHTAVFLMIAMLLAVLPGVVRLAGRDDGAAVQAARACLVGLMAVGVLATLSRSGVFMLPIALVGAFLLARTRQLRVRDLVLTGVGAAAVMTVLAQTPLAGVLRQRYVSAADDARLDYWANTWLAAREALPLGTGFGTFREVYQTVEPVNQVSPLVVNRAHNDFLEWLLVGGLPAAVLLVATIALAAYWIARARRDATDRLERRTPLAVALAGVLIAGSSLVDYPLHGMAMSMLAGALLGLLGRQSHSKVAPAGNAAPTVPPRWVRMGRIVLVALLALWASAVCWSEHWLRADRPDLAVRFQPLHARAWSAWSSALQTAGDPAAASQAARRALSLSPLDARALRVEGVSRLQTGDAQGAATLLSVGAQLGWRDGVTQLWLAEQGLAAGATGFAVQRLDALLRQRVAFDTVIAVLPPLIAQPEGRHALAEQLGYDPGWRATFFNTAARSRHYALGDLLALLGELRRGPKPPQPHETALVRAYLGKDGRFAEAREVWRASGGRGAIADPGFEEQENFTVATGPYVWQATGMSGVSVRPERASPPLSGRAAAISSSGVASGAVLVQTLALDPGMYRIGFSVLAREPRVARGIGLRLVCLDRAGAAVAALGAEGPQGALPLAWQAGADDLLSASARVAVPPDCAGQRLEITISAQDSGPYSLWIDDATVAALNGS
ncbi:O-antigen ligase family protein [Novosphingobium soli]|uniref:O-antigen ligase family protein n=2 Tax=Novosphingobium soli TaxID=574956 RepID=A0ABV6CWG7_9SPHN